MAGGVQDVTSFLSSIGLEQCVQAVVHNGFYTSMEALKGATLVCKRTINAMGGSDDELAERRQLLRLAAFLQSWLVREADIFGGWTTERHKSAPTTDMEVLKVPALREWLHERSRTVLFPTLAACYGFAPAELHYMDLFLVRYDGDTSGAQRGLMPHRDRSLLSFNLVLSDPSSFEGGGTCFDVLGAAEHPVRPTRIGDLVMHTGKARHAGAPVTRGTRHILVGFVGVRSPRVDTAFLQSLTAKLNVKSIERDHEILVRALRAPPADGWAPPAVVAAELQDACAGSIGAVVAATAAAWPWRWARGQRHLNMVAALAISHCKHMHSCMHTGHWQKRLSGGASGHSREHAL